MQNEELRRAWQELDTSRTKYLDLYDLAPVGYLTLSEKGLILEANLFAASLLGQERGLLLKKPFTRFIRQEDQDIFYRTRKQLLETGAQQACELRMVKKDETIFWARLEVAVAQDADGFPVHRVVLIDITDRKRAEEALQQAHDELEERVAARTKELRRSEERYRQLFDSMSEGFLLIEMISDESGKPVSFRYLDANPALERLTHLKRQGIVGKDVREVLPEIEPYWIETFGRVAMTGEPRHIEQFSKDLNGWYQVIVYRPEPGKAAVVYTNVSERRQMEAALRENETLLRGILNSVTESIWVFNAEGRVLLANDTTLSRLSRPPDEVIGHRMVDILPADLARFRMGRLQEVFESTRPVEFEDLREGIFFRHTFYPILDEDRVAKAVVSFSRDITQSRRVEMALRESEERFRMALRHAPISVAVQDLDLRYVWVYNQRTIRSEEIIGRHDSDILTPEEAAHVTAIKRRVLHEGLDLREQLWLDLPRGRVFLDICWEPVRDEAGKVIGVGSAAIDLTRMKLAEEALRRSQEDLTRAQEVGQTGSWRMDVTCNELTWSDENYRIFGIPQGTPLTYETFLGNRSSRRSSVCRYPVAGGLGWRPLRHRTPDRCGWGSEMGAGEGLPRIRPGRQSVRRVRDHPGYYRTKTVRTGTKRKRGAVQAPNRKRPGSGLC